MKKFLLLVLLLLISTQLTNAQTSGLGLAGTFFTQDDQNKLNFFGGKAWYSAKISPQVNWGLFAEFQAAKQEIKEVSFIRNVKTTTTKKQTVTLLKLGAQALFFPGNSKNFYIGAEAFYISGKSEDIKDDGYGFAPKVGLMFKPKQYIYGEIKYNIISFSDEEDSEASKGIGVEIGFIISFD